MNSDIEFSMGLDTSPADEKLNQFQQKLKGTTFITDSPANKTPNEKLSQFQQHIANEFNGTPFRAPPPFVNPTYSRREELAYQRLSLEAERNRLRSSFRTALSGKNQSAAIGGVGSAAMLDIYANNIAGKISDTEEKLRGVRAEEKELNKINQKHEQITGETKSQGKEFTSQLMKLGKVMTVLAAILGVVQAIKKAWKSAWEGLRQGELNKSLGFFSVDREGAFVANTDKTHAMVYAGLANMKSAAPFSVSAYNSPMAKMQELRFKTLRGEGIGDDQYVIAMQRLSDIYGLGMNAEDLLSNGEVKLTDVLNQMMRVVENKVLPQLAKSSGKEKELISGDLMMIFGPELMDAMMAHLSQRYNTGSDMTAIDEVLASGGNEVTNVNIAKSAKAVSESFTELRESWKQLSDIVLVDVTPALVKLAQGLKFVVDKLKSWFHFTPETQDEEGNVFPISVSQWEKGVGSFYDYTNPLFQKPDRDEFAKNKTKKNKEKANEIFAKRSGYVGDIFQALAYSSDAWDANYVAERAENMSIEAQLRGVYQLYKKGLLSDNQYAPVYNNSLQGQLGQIALAMKKGLTFDEFRAELGDEGGSNIIKEWYSESGAFDIGKKNYDNLWEYITQGLSPEQYLDATKGFAASLTPDTTGGRVAGARGYWVDENKDNIIQYGEVKLDITYNDPQGRPVTTTINTSPLRK